MLTPGQQKRLLDELLGRYVHEAPPPKRPEDDMASNGDGNPKFRLSLTVLIALFAAVVSAVSGYVAIRVEIAQAITELRETMNVIVDRHAASPTHVGGARAADIEALSNKIGVLDDKITGLKVDVAELRARKR